MKLLEIGLSVIVAQSGYLQGRAERSGYAVNKGIPVLEIPITPLRPADIPADKVHGAVGILIERSNGQIKSVWPGSDVHRLGVQPGDFLITINGGKYSYKRFCTYMPGPPGTYVHLVFYNRQTRSTYGGTVQRQDVRIFLPYDHIDEHYSQIEKYGRILH